MKKAMCVVVAVALALSLATCELFESLFEEPEAPVYDEQGRLTVELSIFTGDPPASRNMSEQLARVAINYFEVVFSNATGAQPTAANEFYRTAGPRGKTLTIRLPVLHPIRAEGNNAIVFAGNRDSVTGDKILVAIGLVTHLNYGLSTPAIPVSGTTAIGAATENIRFLLHAVDTGFATASTASFQITTTSYQTLSPPSANHLDGDQLNHQRNVDNNDMYPFWKLPMTPDSVTTSAGALKTAATFSYGLPDYSGIIADIEAGFMFDSWAILTGYKEDGMTAVEATPALTPNAPIPDPINIEIVSPLYPTNMGFCLLVPQIPVKAMTTLPTTATHITNDFWTLVNGVYGDALHDNNILIKEAGGDLPITYNAAMKGASLGGALLLCVGEPASANGRPIKILIQWTPK